MTPRIPVGAIARIRLSPVEHHFGIAVTGEVLCWNPSQQDVDNISFVSAMSSDTNTITFILRGTVADNVVTLPAEAFDSLETAPDGVIQGVYVDAFMTVWMEFRVGSMRRGTA